MCFWLENGPLAVRVWLAINYLGAVFVPMNVAYKGGILQHVIDLSDAKVMIAHSSLVPRLAGINRGPVQAAFAVGPKMPAAIPGLQLLPGSDLITGSNTQVPPLDRLVEPWDTQAILFTSGTTGPSKAVITSNLYFHTVAQANYTITTPEDRGLIFTPLFHITGMSAICWALSVGGSIGVVERFNTGTFWKDALQVGSTFFVMMGSIASFLSNLPRSDEEKRTTLRLALLAPMTPEAMTLCRRTGMSFYSVFNMTETSVPIMTELNSVVPYMCGRPRAGIEARLVDEHDNEVRAGSVGQLIVRSSAPWVMSSGYYKNSDATAEAWRNGWFHTGDACRRDEDGNFFYVDRVKDSIRRRGRSSHHTKWRRRSRRIPPSTRSLRSPCRAR